MANKRMFNKSITNSSGFLMMPPTSRLLYYDLGMNADDDGFVEHFGVMRMTEASPDDLRVLEARGFIKVFDDKVLVILDWKENNYIQKDRYTPSKYLKIYKEEVKLLSQPQRKPRIQNVYKMDTQIRLDKSRVDKIRIDKIISEVKTSQEKEDFPINELMGLFQPINPSYKRLYSNKTEREALSRLLKEYGEVKMRNMLSELPKILSQPYAPRITTPYMLEKKLGDLLQFISQERNKKSGKVANI